MLIHANETWSGQDEAIVQVLGQTNYKVIIEGLEAIVEAPGLRLTLSLDEEIYPADDAERTAIILVAQIEGGVEL